MLFWPGACDFLLPALALEAHVILPIDVIRETGVRDATTQPRRLQITKVLNLLNTHTLTLGLNIA
jgi:hypothetical protein